MHTIIRRLVELVKSWFSGPLLPPARLPLEDLSATVFVRQSNDSRSSLEHHIEQELIDRGARVLMANQRAGMALIKDGDFRSLVDDHVHLTVVGVLRVMNCQVTEMIWTETRHDYEVRRAKYRVEFNHWFRLSAVSSRPEPILKPREGRIEKVPGLHFELSFRLIASDGALLASGTCKIFDRADRASHEESLRKLAKEAITYLDHTDVWSKIVIV